MADILRFTLHLHRHMRQNFPDQKIDKIETVVITKLQKCATGKPKFHYMWNLGLPVAFHISILVIWMELITRFSTAVRDALGQIGHFSKKRVPFRGVRGGTLWHFLAQTYPWDHLARRKNVHQNGHEHVTFVIFC